MSRCAGVEGVAAFVADHARLAELCPRLDQQHADRCRELAAMRDSHERLRIALAECVAQLGTFPPDQMNNSDRKAVSIAREALAAATKGVM